MQFIQSLAALTAQQYVLIGLAGFAAASLLALLFVNVRLKRQLDATRFTLAQAKSEAERATLLEADLADVQEEVKSLNAQVASDTARLEEREKAMADLTQRFQTEFQALSAKTLETAHESFLRRADETFAKHKQSVEAEAAKRAKSIDDMLKPVSDTLHRYEKGLTEMRAADAKREGEITSKISELALNADAVRKETARLSSALRSGPKTRGRWGEEALANVIELAGLSSYCDFQTQASVSQDDKRKQPDVVVRLPGRRHLVIDAKVSLNGYLQAVDAIDDAAREAYLNQHAEEIWTHVRLLAQKDYASAFRDSLDFVIMFIPGENFFSAAIEKRPDMFQQAFDKRVLLATPTTLVAILKSVAYGWRQEKAAENAEQVAVLGKELYESLRKMGDNLASVGASLERTVKQYNTFVGGLEGRVLPRARKFQELEVEGTDVDVSPLAPVETDVREVRSDRDMLLEDKHQRHATM